jgi:hypothetical protein
MSDGAPMRLLSEERPRLGVGDPRTTPPSEIARDLAARRLEDLARQRAIRQREIGDERRDMAPPHVSSAAVSLVGAIN